MNYKQIILNALLDKYEKSKSYLNDVNRRIIIKADKIKQYNVENYDDKLVFHNIVKELKRKNLIDFSWHKFEENNLLNEIWLIKENVDETYCEIGRNNPKQAYQEILVHLEKAKFNMQWIIQFCEETKEYMLKNQKENALLPKDKAKEVLVALQEINNMQSSKNEGNILKRTFSMKCYHDSKFFEKNIESILIRIIRKYYINADNENILEVYIETKPKLHKCPSCHYYTKHVHDYRIQKIQHVLIGSIQSYLYLNKRRYVCPHCNKRFYEDYISCSGSIVRR